MIKENEFNEAMNLKNSFLTNLMHLLLILSDFLMIFLILMFSILYLPEYILKFRERLFANNESVIFVGLSDVLLIFSIFTFLFLTYKKVLGKIFLFISFTRLFYIKFLNFYYQKSISWEFLNSYRFTKMISSFIIGSSLLISILSFIFYGSIDSNGINNYFFFYKYNNIEWSQIDLIEYKLILWYDQRRSEYKLREKFIYKGSFGELDILDSGNSNNIINILFITKKYSKVRMNTDNPNEIRIKEILNSYNKDKINRIFEIYNQIQKNY